MFPRLELEAQGEGRKPLDLLRKAHGSKWSEGGVALPPFDGLFGLHTAFERLLTHQVEGQSLRLLRNRGPRDGVMGAVDVQVIVEIHLDGQLSCC